MFKQKSEFMNLLIDPVTRQISIASMCVLSLALWTIDPLGIIRWGLWRLGGGLAAATRMLRKYVVLWRLGGGWVTVRCWSPERRKNAVFVHGGSVAVAWRFGGGSVAVTRML